LTLRHSPHRLQRKCPYTLASGVNLGSSFANYKAGGRTSTSVLVTAVFILVAVLLLTPVIAYIPRAVIAGLLVVVSLQLIDRWSIQILRRMLAREFVYWRNMTVDLIVILLVATVAIAANLVAAVSIGVGVAVLSFLTRMSKSLVRRAYHGDVIHSRRTRDPRLMEILHAHGRKILVFELEARSSSARRRTSPTAWRPPYGTAWPSSCWTSSASTRSPAPVPASSCRFTNASGKHLLVSHLDEGIEHG